MAVPQNDIARLLEPPRTGSHDKLSFEDYLAWEGENQSVEWIDGEILIMPPASTQHEDLFVFLSVLLRTYVNKHKLGKILGSRLAMRLEVQRRGREPDLLFVARERLHLLKKNYLDGPADLVIEITSPESFARDRGEKFNEYEAAGIREYWLIDPERQHAEFYRLDTDLHYSAVPLEADNTFRSQVIPGFWLRTEWLWQLPEEIGILNELGLV